MESPNNPTIIKPSRKFLIRGGIATLVIALILLVQTPWFFHLISKKKATGVSVDNTTVGDVIGKDSNGNGIADWEERLWGLDPTVTTTNGISNKSIIEEKRRSLQATDTTTGTLNETDTLARELFGFTNALGQDSSVDKNSLGALATKLGQEGVKPDLLPSYSLKNINTVATSRGSLVIYQKSLANTLASYDTSLPEIDVVINSIENGDYSNLDSLTATVSAYKTLAKKLLKIPAPIGLAQYHLDIANSIAGLAKSFEKMKLLEDNGISALVGLSEYRYNDQKLTTAIEGITVYLKSYGIIQ